MELEKLLTPKSNKKSDLVFYFIVVSLQHRGVAFTYLDVFFQRLCQGQSYYSVFYIEFQYVVRCVSAATFLISFLLISGLIVFQYTIKHVHGWKTEYYLGVGDFIVAPRSCEFRDFFLSETSSKSEVRTSKITFQ